MAHIDYIVSLLTVKNVIRGGNETTETYTDKIGTVTIDTRAKFPFDNAKHLTIENAIARALEIEKNSDMTPVVNMLSDASEDARTFMGIMNALDFAYDAYDILPKISKDRVEKDIRVKRVTSARETSNKMYTAYEAAMNHTQTAKWLEDEYERDYNYAFFENACWDSIMWFNEVHTNTHGDNQVRAEIEYAHSAMRIVFDCIEILEKTPRIEIIETYYRAKKNGDQRTIGWKVFDTSIWDYYIIKSDTYSEGVTLTNQTWGIFKNRILPMAEKSYHTRFEHVLARLKFTPIKETEFVVES